MRTFRQPCSAVPLTVRQHFLFLFIAAFLASLIFTAASVKPDARMMDHPEASDEYSLLEIATLGGYTLLLLYVPSLVALAALYPVFLLVVKFTRPRFFRIERLPLELFFLFAILIFAHSFSSVCLGIFPSGFVPTLMLVPFYFVLPVLIFSKYGLSARREAVHKGILLAIVCLVGILASANNIGWLSRSAENGIKWSVVFLTIAGCLFIANYRGIGEAVLNPSRTGLSVGGKRIGRLVCGFMIGIIILTFSLSFSTFLHERREEEIPSGEASSSCDSGINVILVVIDALRADHLGCYGYSRDTTPNLDSFAQESVLFENCYVQASWTKPSTASLFTSLYPSMHGAVSRRTSILHDEVTTIAEIFKKSGYVTYGYVANPNIKSVFNYDQGFDFYDDYLMRDKLYYAALRNLRKRFRWLERVTNKRFNFSDRDNARLANKRITPWLEKHRGEDFFMYVHYMDPHDPYLPPSPYDTMYSYEKGDDNSRNISLYDGEIRFCDEHFGRFLGKLKEGGIYDKSMIVITSDHGEAFGEHNDTIHGRTIYNELLKVPLIIKYPQSQHKGMRISKQVRSIDVLPSILDAVEISDSTDFEGLSVTPLLANAEADLCPYVYVENDVDGVFVHDGIIESNTWKYIYTTKSALRDIAKLGHEELYNLTDDPKELRNLIEGDGEVPGRLREKLDSYRKRCDERRLKPKGVLLDAETIRNLKSLGYAN